MSRRYFHGGPPGLTKILPPSLTGASGLYDYGTAGVARRDRVYITTDFLTAIFYAVGHPCGDGTVYEVRPIFPLERDLDCSDPDLSFACRSAEVIKVYQVTPAWRETILSFMTQQAQQ